MAATLFIIKIPSEKKELAPHQLEDDDQKDIDCKERRNNSTECLEQSTYSSSINSDLEVDAQKVEKGSLTSLSKVSNSIDELSTNREKDEITENVAIGSNEDQLKSTGSTESMSFIPSLSQNVNKEGNGAPSSKSSEEINSPTGETFEPKSPENEVTMLDFITKEPLETVSNE